MYLHTALGFKSNGLKMLEISFPHLYDTVYVLMDRFHRFVGLLQHQHALIGLFC